MKNIDGLSVFKAETQIREYLSTLYVTKPKKPLLVTTTPTAELVEEYKVALQNYETAFKEYQIKMIFMGDEQKRLFTLLRNLIKEESGLNTIVPAKYRDKVFSYAYEQGHSSGYLEVYHYLCNLADIFE
jgi:hypothetical protein